MIQRLGGYRGQVEPEKFKQLVEGCYEVLLLWAESEAGNAGQALRLLDTAGRWPGRTICHPAQTFHLRRARYLVQTGDEAGARAERAGPQPCLPEARSTIPWLPSMPTMPGSSAGPGGM